MVLKAAPIRNDRADESTLTVNTTLQMWKAMTQTSADMGIGVLIAGTDETCV